MKNEKMCPICGAMHEKVYVCGECQERIDLYCNSDVNAWELFRLGKADPVVRFIQGLCHLGPCADEAPPAPVPVQKATCEKRTVEVPVTTKQAVDTYVLTLSEEEAQALRTIVGLSEGIRHHSIEGFSRRIYMSLCDAGVPINHMFIESVIQHPRFKDIPGLNLE